ncbi:DUF724 domain-containing protein 3-like isoform X1 [Lycium ferocissimum]|uniref:DUF724 domain-containing protein 3-like isoform X1 n=1 Tax=Lycium ferocissimum TaxID=112874 RepID=UPI002814CF89|nr:DUF724 domain-containing protein 3-like isoform X1 [Lycium ferocissimum]
MRGGTRTTRLQQQLQYLTKGSTVEVTSDEEGFKGVWFEATILGLSSPTSKKNRVLVQYNNIFADENGSEPLRELLSVSFVRPVPPLETVHSFELYDVVDASYKDGWWTGVVTRVLDGFRYQVTFNNPPDELVFGVTELRFHKKWVKGKWVRPGKQRTGSLMFSVGKNVEVAFDRDDCRDAWFPSKVLEHCENGLFLVESYRTVNKKAAIDKVTVDSFHIRPLPPQITRKKFNLLEKVDAFYDLAWWSGVITRELAGSKYIVFFKTPNKEKEFSDSDLRPHMDWKDGQWFTNRDIPIPSDCQTNGSNNCNDASLPQKDVPLGRSSTMNEISEEKTHHSIKNIEDLNETPSTDEILLSNRDAASPQPLEPPKDMSLEACKLSSKPSKKPRTKSPFGHPSPRTENAEMKSSVTVARDEQPHIRSWQNRTRKRCQELGEEKGGALEKLRGLKSPTTGNKGIAIENAADVTPKRSMRKETDVPVIIGLECTKIRSSKAKKSRQINNESLEAIGDQKQIDAAVDGIQETNHLGDGESSQKRKRGRPPKKLISIPTDKEPSEDHSKDQSSGPVELEVMVIEDGKEQVEVPNQKDGKELVEVPNQKDGKELVEVPNRQDGTELVEVPNQKYIEELVQVPDQKDGKEQAQVQIGHSRKRGRTRKVAHIKLSNEKAVQSSSQQHEKHYVKREKRQAKSLNIESQAQGSVDSSGVKTSESNRIASDGEEVLAEIPYNGFDDQPLAKWFEEIQSPTSVDGSRVSPARSPKKCAETREKQDIPMQPPVNGTPAAQTESQSLPFVKNTLLWSTIESMDIFRRIPQKPHFNPLENCKESSREGVAIGYMVTFLSIVERTSRLHYDDPRSTIQEILETLSDLETQGFDVQLVRDRLTELLLMKDKQEKLETQVADIDNQLIMHNTDKERIDGEIEEINKQIAELQDKLSLATSRKEVKDREIAGLTSKLKDIQADTKKAHDEYDSLASKPF